MALPHPLVSKLIAKTKDLPSLPGPVLEAVRLAADPNTNTAQIAKAISSDVSLAARVLRLSNSAYYGLPRQVTSIQESVMLLGKATVRNVALVAATQSWFDKLPLDRKGEPILLWQHAVGVAAASQAIADVVDKKLIEDAFCAGLLHNVGKALFVLWFKDKMPKIMEEAIATKTAIYKMERKKLGYDHQEAGFALAESWNLPESILMVIRYHHEPNDCNPTNSLVDIVHVADYVTKSLGIGVGAEEMVIEVEPEALDRLGISTPEKLDMLSAQVLEKYEAAQSLLSEE